MEIIGQRLIIRPLKVEDVYQMRNWGFHKTPLLGDYNFPMMTDGEIEKWYRYKTKRWFDKYFGILTTDNRLIGYMGIKDIKVIRRESVLGIVMDPNCVNQGYGTETLYTFLNYYFNEMKMKSMLLEVAEFNKRAIKVYKKIGFVSIGYYLDEFFDQNLDLNHPNYLEEESSFVIDDKKIYNYIYKMKLTKRRFLKYKKMMR